MMASDCKCTLTRRRTRFNCFPEASSYIVELGHSQLRLRDPTHQNHLSRKRHPGSIRYILAGPLGSAPFDFMKWSAPKYDV